MTTSTHPVTPMDGSREPALRADGPQRRALRIAIVLVAILAPQAILFGPSLFGGKIALPVNLMFELVPNYRGVPEDLNHVLWDPLAQYEPMRKFVAAELRGGRVPLWNPHLFCGAPVFINTWSPFQWLYYLWPDPAWLAWLVLLKSLVAGAGAYWFLRRVARVGFWPATFGAAIYPLTMFFVLWQYYVISNACTWLPWLLSFTDSAVRRPRGPGLIGAALVTAAVFSEGLGAPWPHMLLASGLYFLWALSDQHGWRRIVSPRALQAVAAMVCAWGIGGGLSALQNLPAADYLRSSHRIAARTEGLVEQPPAGWRAWEEWLLPHHFGDMSTKSVYLPQLGNQLEGAPSASAGLLTALVLAPLAFCDPRRRSLNLFWLGFGLFGMAFQADIPVVSELFRLFPFKVLRNNRFTFFTGWATVALAVNGLEVALTARRPWRAACWAAIAAILLVGLHVSLFLMEVPTNPVIRGVAGAANRFQRMYTWELAVCVAALAAWLMVRGRRWKGSRFATSVGGLVVLELIVNAWRVNPQCDRELYYPSTSITEAAQQGLPGRTAMARYLRPNVGIMYGLAEVRGYDGADPLRIVRLYRVVDPEWPMVSPHAVTSTFDPPPSPIMDMLNLRYVFHAGPAPAHAKVLASDRNGWLEERTRALPRAYVPRRVLSVPDDATCLEKLQDRQFDARAVAYVEGNVAIDPAAEAEGTAEVVVDESTRVVVTARMRTPGMLLLADSWDAGWQAYVDGRQVPVARANFLIRGVALAAGDHTVEFRYEPASFTWGLRISAGCALALAVWGSVVGRSLRLTGPCARLPVEQPL